VSPLAAGGSTRQPTLRPADDAIETSAVERRTSGSIVRANHEAVVVCVDCSTQGTCVGEDPGPGWIDLDGWRCPECASRPVSMSPRATRPDDGWAWREPGQSGLRLSRERGQEADNPRERPTLPGPLDED
jgi:hypothetical protein